MAKKEFGGVEVDGGLEQNMGEANVWATHILAIVPRKKSQFIYHHADIQNQRESTLGTEMFGVGDFWLEIRVIIKISKISC